MKSILQIQKSNNREYARKYRKTEKWKIWYKDYVRKTQLAREHYRMCSKVKED